jgi:hypothetical protein
MLRHFLTRKYMYIKPGPNFKLSKATKTKLALGKFRDEHDRAAFKRAMVQAELTAAVKPPSGKKDRN